MAQFTSRTTTVAQGYVELFAEFETGGSMWTGDGDRERKLHVSFDAPFLHPPLVQVSPVLVDADTEVFLRLHLLAESIGRNGFDLICRTWSDSRLARLHVSWLAIGEGAFEDDWDV